MIHSCFYIAFTSAYCKDSQPGEVVISCHVGVCYEYKSFVQRLCYKFEQILLGDTVSIKNCLSQNMLYNLLQKRPLGFVGKSYVIWLPHCDAIIVKISSKQTGHIFGKYFDPVSEMETFNWKKISPNNNEICFYIFSVWKTFNFAKTPIYSLVKMSLNHRETSSHGKPHPCF